MPSGTWFAGWNTGDVVTASEFKKGVGAVYDTTLAAAAASIDVTGLPTSYAHFRIVIVARGDTAATTAAMSVRFNNDSGANYDRQTIEGNGTTVAAGQVFAATSCYIADIPAGSAPASVFGSADVMLPNYAATSVNKVFTAVHALKYGTAAGSLWSRQTAGFWRSSAAINRVTLLTSAGNFDIGTRVTIYAMGA